MGDDNAHALLPIACRFVPADLWLTTHIEYSWTVKEAKQWLIAKCNADAVVTRQQQPNVPQPRFRAASPVGFASVRSSTDLTDSETEGALSLDGHTSLTAAARARRTNKILQLDALNVTNNYNSAEDASAQYCLISFSCGHILDDSQKLSAYNLRAHELLELQRRNDAVYISRPVYAKPYFDLPLLVLKMHPSHADPFASDMTNRFNTVRAEKGVARTPSDGDIRAAAKRAPKKTRAGVSVPHRAPQWKERRLVLKDGHITVWRDRQDKEPITAFKLEQLVALHAPDHAGLKLPCACPDAAQCPANAAQGCSRHVVCARFAPPPPPPKKKRPKEPERYYPGAGAVDARLYLGVPSYAQSVASVAQQRTGSVRARASTDADRPTESGSDAERKPDELLVLRLPDERSFYHILRILHYTDTKVPLSSTYVSSAASGPSTSKARSPTTMSPGSSPSSSSPGLSTSPHSTPTTGTTSDMSPFPSLSLRKSARPTTVLDATQLTTHRSLLYYDDHPALAISVRYPAWRTHVLQRAEHAGKSRLEPPPETQSDSEAEWDGWAYDFQCRLARRLEKEPQPAQQQQRPKPPPRVRSAESLRENKGTLGKGGGPKSPLRERILSDADGKKRKLSISIFIPGASGAGRTRSASVASPAAPRRKPSASALFSPKPRLAHQTSSSTLGTAYETDADAALRVPAVLKKPRRSAETSGSDRRARSASVSLAGSRAGSPSTFGHARSRAPSEDVQLTMTPSTPTPTPITAAPTPSGFGRLVRGFSMRK